MISDEALLLWQQNAHGVDGYIGSQGPLPSTVADFWRMLMQYKVKCVIMVCREMEGGKVSVFSEIHV